MEISTSTREGGASVSSWPRIDEGDNEFGQDVFYRGGEPRVCLEWYLEKFYVPNQFTGFGGKTKSETSYR